MDAKELMFSAIKSQFCTVEIPEVSEELLESVYYLSKKHDMTHIVAAALESQAQGEIKARLKKQKMLAVYRREQLNTEEKRICRVLEKNGINYIPLKGSVIKNYYPEEWIRTSCDIDILVHTEAAKKAAELICAELEYTYDGKSLHDHQLSAKNGVHLELHYELDENELLSKIWEYAKPAGNANRYELSPEYIVFYNIMHAKYHFFTGGCGIKPFLDMWVLDNKLHYDKNTLLALISESGCEKFYNSFIALMKVWFDGGTHTELTRKMEQYILQGGVYGTRENLGGASVHREGGMAKYLLSRIFKPKKALKAQYPKLEKYPILLPYYQVKRWFNLFDNDKRMNVEKEFSGSMENNGISEMMKELGL